MTIQSIFGKNNILLANKSPSDKRRAIDRALEKNKYTMLQEANERVKQKQKEQRKRSPKKQTGAVRLSNTDSIGRARQVRARLLAKLQEVYGSDMDERSRGASAMDIQLQINRVDRQIIAIRRRERAIEEEKMTRRKDDTPEARRRRLRDMQEKRIYVRRDFLYHADKGGFDPNNVVPSFDIGGNIGTMDIAAAADIGADFNMEVVL
jgi:hypothetical protein